MSRNTETTLTCLCSNEFVSVSFTQDEADNGEVECATCFTEIALENERLAGLADSVDNDGVDRAAEDLAPTTRPCNVCATPTTNPVLPPYSGWHTGYALCAGDRCGATR